MREARMEQGQSDFQILVGFFYYIYLFIYQHLAVPGLGCSIKYLHCGMQDSFVVSCELLVVTCGICFPDKRLNKGSLHWECWVLAPGPPGKSPKPLLLIRTLILVLLNEDKWENHTNTMLYWGKKVLFWTIKIEDYNL